MEEELIGSDYFTKSVLELQENPDFSPLAFRIVAAISKMPTKQLEQIELWKVGKDHG